MRVIICMWEHEFFIEVGFQEPVIEIKRKIEQLLGVAIAAQSLSVSGIELLDGLDMEDYPIVTEGTKIDLTITNRYCSCKTQIVVKVSARQHCIEVETTETVSSLKEKIHIIDGTPIKRMSLFFSGKELEDDFCNLSEYGICESSEIFVFMKNVRRMKDMEPTSKSLSLVVQTSSNLLNGSSIPLKMRNSSTVNELRQLLLSRKVLPMDDYLFIHRQRIMRDNCSLRWHGVGDGDILYVFKGTVMRSES